ncbi:MAG: L-2-amino-thiazoline-4-carboxylic acid hydrolase [Promethearchaeota archaeon]
MKKMINVYNENAKINFKIVDAVTICLTGLETFLKDLKNNLPDSLTRIINDLNVEYGKKEDFGIQIDTKYDFLSEYPELIKRSINAILSFLNFSKYSQKSIHDEIEVEVIDIIRTFNHFEYSFMTLLLNFMPREEVIEYIKRLADDVVHSRKDPTRYVENFDELIDRTRVNLERWQAQDVSFKNLNDEKFIYKVKKCRWAETMKDLDHELSYYIICYTDFENTKNLNPNFVLTRFKTKMMGDEFCDFCTHDTRKVKEIIHPSDEEFLDLN